MAESPADPRARSPASSKSGTRATSNVPSPRSTQVSTPPAQSCSSGSSPSSDRTTRRASSISPTLSASRPAPGTEADNVGEIELALRVVRSELGEEPEEQLCAGGVETWVDLGDGTLDVARVPLFDDAGDLALGSAGDSAIAGGSCEVERHQRQVRARG